MTVRVQRDDFDPGAEMDALLAGRKDIGGVVSFVGLVRDFSDARNVGALTLEHYPGMTEKALVAIEAEALARFDIQASLIVHRHGRMEPGERIVLVITASAHRGEAFRASEFLIDWLKTRRDGAVVMTEHEGERIAKRLARAGVASRREVERMIEAGRISVNGKRLTSPALNVTPDDTILVDGKPVAAAEPTRIWRYYKPAGLVTSASDEQGRSTIFDHLPKRLPRVMSVGRLDLNSEGLLLLTNDGGLKRALELPATGWVRQYRARAFGTPEPERLARLADGIRVDGEQFGPIQATIERQAGRNCWLLVEPAEGRNREVRRALEAAGLTVNRLIRTRYGPFALDKLQRGEVTEVPGFELRKAVRGFFEIQRDGSRG